MLKIKKIKTVDATTCKNSLICAQDKTLRIIQSISSYNSFYDKCMSEQCNTTK